MYVSPQGLLVAGDDPQLNPNDKGLIAAVLPHAAGVRIVAKGKHQPYGFATGPVDIKATAGAGMQVPGIGSNYLTNDTVRLYSTANATDTVWERPVKQVSVLVVFIKYSNASGATPLFGNGSPNTAPYEAWSLDDAAGALQFGYSAGGTFRFLNGGAGSVVNGRLNVALATYDGATARLFLNGVLLNSGSQTGDLTYPSAVDRGPGFCSFFDYPFNNRALNGRIFLGGLWETGLPLGRGIEITKSPQAAFEAVLGSSRLWLPMPAAAGGGSVSLIVADATHGHTADGLALTSSTALSVAEATHAHAADAITLVVGSVLTVSEATHAHAADSLTLTAASALAVADATHAHAADSGTLTAASVLAIQEALHAHAADATVLTMDSALAVAETLHAQAADNLVLGVAGTTNLVVADVAHAHSADVLVLTSAHALAIADAIHGHSVEGLTLSVASVLAIQEALHAHAAENLALETTGSAVLLLADSLHAHTSDGAALTVDAWLVAADAAHGHSADNVVFTFGGAIPTDTLPMMVPLQNSYMLVAPERSLMIVRV